MRFNGFQQRKLCVLLVCGGREACVYEVQWFSTEKVHAKLSAEVRF